MSDASQDVLLDSNAYFRLGNSIRPLLQTVFGSSPQYTLYVLAELDDEYASSTRLHSKFNWVSESEYRIDRRARRYELRGADRVAVLNAFSFLMAYADDAKINLSREDLKALAVGFVKGIPVVTDDIGMCLVAGANGIECWSTIKLLQIMVASGRIDMDTIKEIFEYWEYEKDLPVGIAKLRQLFKEHFNTDCPI
jgi:hypothetical protein